MSIAAVCGCRQLVRSTGKVYYHHRSTDMREEEEEKRDEETKKQTERKKKEKKQHRWSSHRCQLGKREEYNRYPLDDLRPRDHLLCPDSHLCYQL